MLTSDKLIVVNYPIGAGGKFLINCLGLGYNSVLQHRELAELQFNGDLSPDDKFNLIIKRVSGIDRVWDDLGLGCLEYFGRDLDVNPRYITEDGFYPIVSNVAKKNWYFFIAAHTLQQRNITKSIWKNCKTIQFYSSTYNFFANYRSDNGLTKYWNTIKGSSWPEVAPKSKEEVFQLPGPIIDELINRFNGNIFSFVINDIDTNYDLLWDTDWFLSDNDTVDNVEKFYNYFGITGFNPVWISEYRMAWLDKIKNTNIKRIC